MKLRLLLFVMGLLWVSHANAQSVTQYVQPEYKIRLRDSSARYIQIINYFDRTFYTKDVYLKQKVGDSSAQYYLIQIDAITGIGKVPAEIVKNVDVHIAKTFILNDINLKQDKLNKIEIRSDGGFLSLPLKWGRAGYKPIEARLINAYDSTEIKLEIPLIKEMPMGKYYLSFNTIPQIRKTVYLKPSIIYQKHIYKSIPFQVANAEKYGDYKLYYSNYPYKDYKLCSVGQLGSKKFEIYLQPKKLYEIRYRKKGKRRYKKKKFYMDISMEIFIMTLE